MAGSGSDCRMLQRAQTGETSAFGWQSALPGKSKQVCERSSNAGQQVVYPHSWQTHSNASVAAGQARGASTGVRPAERWLFERRSNLSSLYPKLYQRLIDLLIQARKNAGITQVELGKRIGRRQTFVSKFELGERRLDVAEFIEISRAIGVDPFVMTRKAFGNRTQSAC